LSFLKEMKIMDILEGFLPEVKDFVNCLKTHGKGEGMVGVSLRNVYAEVEFALEIEELFDLL
jgi:hypothetical protein